MTFALVTIAPMENLHVPNIKPNLKPNTNLYPYTDIILKQNPYQTPNNNPMSLEKLRQEQLL